MPAELLLSRAEQEAMIEQWRLYAYSLANKFYFNARKWLSLEECQAIAVEGLWDGARRFQPGRGVQFSTYATWWVMQNLHRAKRKAMGVPVHHKYGTEGFAEASRVLCPKVSLNADYRSGSGTLTFAETVPSRPEADHPEFPDDFWKRADKWLDPVGQKVIRLRFHDELTLEEAGSVLGITRERVRQLEAKALEKLRRHADFGDCVEDLALTRRL